jgi:hypothetical protein
MLQGVHFQWCDRHHTPVVGWGKKHNHHRLDLHKRIEHAISKHVTQGHECDVGVLIHLHGSLHQQPLRQVSSNQPLTHDCRVKGPLFDDGIGTFIVCGTQGQVQCNLFNG